MAGKSQMKLTEADVIEIKLLLAEGELSQTAIGEKFGVGQVAVYQIKSGKSWSHVVPDNPHSSKMIVYKLTNKLNNKSFISSTILPHEIRMLHHEIDMQKFEMKSKPLYQAMKEYGYDSFTFERLDVAKNIKELTLKEAYWIQVNDSISNGYNTHLPILISSVKMLKRLIKIELDRQADAIKQANFKPRGTTERTMKGSNHTNSKLNEESVRQIKLLLKEKKMTQTAIAKQFKINEGAISMIKNGKAWNHVTI